MMSALRDEIRAILREELAALRSEARAPVVESIPIASGADLTRFARDLMARAADPDFREKVESGALWFELAGAAPEVARVTPSHPVPVSTPPAVVAGAVGAAKPPVIHKPLVTERDLNALAKGQRHLRVSRNSRLTPLARDEARRLGIRIERCEA